MAPTVLSWFYSSPGNNAFQIGERVRQSLWEARLGGLWLDVVRDSSPYKMAGAHNGHAVELEWTPGEWLRLAAAADAPEVVQGLSFILGMQPALTYTTAHETSVWEWRTGDSEDRWNEVSGNPAYRKPKRMT